MKKLRTAPSSPNGSLPLREIVLYAPRRWDHMTASERKVVERVHTLLAAGHRIETFRQQPDGSWEIRPANDDDDWDDGDEWDDEDEWMSKPKRPYGWWPPDAPGYVTVDGGTHVRRRSARGWWTVYVAAYTAREAYHLAALGEWAPDHFTPGIRRMFSDDGAVVLSP